VLSKSGPGAVLARCDATSGEYMLGGVDQDFRFWGCTNDPIVQLDGQPPAGTLKVKVEAANEAGNGKASDTQTIELAQ
jgi:hypothetical protein